MFDEIISPAVTIYSCSKTIVSGNSQDIVRRHGITIKTLVTFLVRRLFQLYSFYSDPALRSYTALWPWSCSPLLHCSLTLILHCSLTYFYTALTLLHSALLPSHTAMTLTPTAWHFFLPYRQDTGVIGTGAMQVLCRYYTGAEACLESTLSVVWSW